jgi:hypothetical protein
VAVVAKAKHKNKQSAIEERFQERYDYALEIKNMQDEKTQAAINRLVAQMERMAPIRESEKEKRLQYYSFTWIAVRLLVACAEWNIRVENFTLPEKKCARCLRPAK